MRLLVLLILAIFSFSSLVKAAEETSLKAKVETAPKIFQKAGTRTATLKASRWPDFSNCKGETTCCNKLASIKFPNNYRSGKEPVFSKVDGLYREIPTKDAESVLISWTLRIEGATGSSVKPEQESRLCSGAWTGTVMESFKGGQVYSKAYVAYGNSNDYQPIGQDAAMTVPDGGSVTVTAPPPVFDPTHTGSCTLKVPENTDKIKVQIYWKNDTALNITSKADYQDLMVTVLPKGHK
ncbi:MAG: hypothetical protein MUF05_01205 [Candidatus Omnitrophica bacterium]|jgi:hypothetical protein|nr:hypothetical protein [Candidatus Omnitrophota bacterium]